MAVGFDGLSREYDVFTVLIRTSIDDSLLARVIPWDESYALVGRDIIDNWEVILNGPDATMTISRKR